MAATTSTASCSSPSPSGATNTNDGPALGEELISEGSGPGWMDDIRRRSARELAAPRFDSPPGDPELLKAFAGIFGLLGRLHDDCLLMVEVGGGKGFPEGFAVRYLKLVEAYEAADPIFRDFAELFFDVRRNEINDLQTGDGQPLRFRSALHALWSEYRTLYLLVRDVVGDLEELGPVGEPTQSSVTMQQILDQWPVLQRALLGSDWVQLSTAEEAAAHELRAAVDLLESAGAEECDNRSRANIAVLGDPAPAECTEKIDLCLSWAALKLVEEDQRFERSRNSSKTANHLMLEIVTGDKDGRWLGATLAAWEKLLGTHKKSAIQKTNTWKLLVKVKTFAGDLDALRQELISDQNVASEIEAVFDD